MNQLKYAAYAFVIVALLTISGYKGSAQAEVWCIAFRVCGNSTYNSMWHSGPYPSMHACQTSPVCNPY